ncbi:gag-protease polyprotein [Trifolium pratense]|uniref:Gag-protease polyprotein n=1 Tax=Trifolium pratense TaxID=57577 RepID=A0A2K3N0T7_TRIPR|nr:gag-protease polyprotein [Trifolium pratense]
MDKEGGLVNRPPLLVGASNYDYWKSRMTAFLKQIDSKTWKAVLRGWDHPVKVDKEGKPTLELKPEEEWSQEEDALALANSKALYALYNGVDKHIFRLIKKCASAKEAWSILQTIHEGTSKVKMSRLQLLTTKFENLRMMDYETIQEFHMTLLDFEIGQNLVDLVNIETDEEPQPKHVKSGVGRRLRIRTTQPTSSAKVTPAVTKKAKGSYVKPVKYGAKKSWSKVVPPSERKKNVLKRKSAPSSDSDFDAEKDASTIKPPTKKAIDEASSAKGEVSDHVVCKTIIANQVKVWPKKQNVPAMKLTRKYVILNRIAAANWVPTKHSSDIATGLGKLIMIGTGTKFNSGQYIFNQIVQHAKTSVTKQPIAFAYLLCEIILSQHTSIRHDDESSKARESPLTIHQKLFSKQHVPDIVGPSNAAADTPMTRKEIIAMLEATCKELDEKKLQYERMIHTLKLEEAAVEAANASVDETMSDEASGEEEEADSEVEEEESDSSEMPSDDATSDNFSALLMFAMPALRGVSSDMHVVL